MKAPTVAAGPITPFNLSQELTQVVARVCKCEGAWVQHNEPLTFKELDAIHLEIDYLLGRLTVAVGWHNEPETGKKDAS